jgi:hypothetical protein
VPQWGQGDEPEHDPEKACPGVEAGIKPVKSLKQRSIQFETIELWGKYRTPEGFFPVRANAPAARRRPGRSKIGNRFQPM